MAQFTEEEKTLRRIEKRFGKGVVEYGLIEEGDRILIGLSGGKDSLALVELLARRSRILKPRFSVIAVHVVMKNIPYQSDVDYLRNYTESCGIPFVLYETEFDASTDTRKSPCFLCSWNRRKALFTVAKEQKCNKIALGHHMDDILETLLMNITYQGAFSTMPPRLVMKKFDMTIIRPMCMVHEADLIELAALHDYRKQVKNCPYESQSSRSDMKGILRQLEAMNPEGIILSPGPKRPWNAKLCVDTVKRFQGRIPILGVCLGHQVIGHCAGAVVEKGVRPIHGKVTEIHNHGTGFVCSQDCKDKVSGA